MKITVVVVGGAVKPWSCRSNLSPAAVGQSSPVCSVLRCKATSNPTADRSLSQNPDNNSSEPTFEVIIPSVRFSVFFQWGFGVDTLGAKLISCCFGSAVLRRHLLIKVWLIC